MGTSTDTAEPVPYSENNPNHEPDPLYQTGVVDTTGTMGDTGNQINKISPVFDDARAAAFGEDNGLDEDGEPVDEAEADGEDDELSFRTKAEAEAYADDNGLDVDKALPAAEYKAAVAEAANTEG